MATTILAFRTSTYARNIYMFGVERFSATEGYGGIPEEYIPYVKQFAADKYYIDDLNLAALSGWITDQEYADTLALKGPEDPQYRPAVTLNRTATVSGEVESI